MDPPDAPATFLGASPFTDYMRELSSQDIADRASLTITSQNDRLTLPIALTIASCLDDPITEDRFDGSPHHSADPLCPDRISRVVAEQSPRIVNRLDDPLAGDRPVTEWHPDFFLFPQNVLKK
jgi:hypothetical protein